ncbi:cell adhesion molecule 1-like [Littorina saxatilis]|uniref:cell adhesion molecule 1-like n=1 Tax=Littorina saxatilis TaxID=31220 RepID=UPI0038B60860
MKFDLEAAQPNIHVREQVGVHTHPPDENEIARSEFTQRLREEVSTNPGLPPKRVFEAQVATEHRRIRRQARPSADPVITCFTAQGQYVPENTDLNCNCSASDLGHPKGRLRVYRGNNEQISGSYGEIRVAFSEANVSRDDDGTVFRCVVEWATTDSPRETSFTLHVAYAAEIKQFTANKQHQNLTINENSSITLTCTALGRPTPGMIISKDGNSLQQVPKGDHVTEIQTSNLTYRRSQATCDLTGDYVCEVDNDLGRQSSNHLTVLVNFPDVRSFTFRVNDSDTNITGNIKLSATCFTTDTDYDVTCSVIVSDVASKEAEGLYTFSAANAFGQEHFQFKVIVNGVDTF